MPRPRKASAADSPGEQSPDQDSDSSGALRPPRRKVAKKDANVNAKKAKNDKPASKRVLPPLPAVRDAKPSTIGESDSDEEEAARGLLEPGIEDADDLTKMKIPPKPEAIMRCDNSKRLVIKEIIVENFKSYYGRQRIGPFHHNFTSIIGPNGSGKSNVIDALLFVFGYKATKIRSTKIAVLIHSSAGKDDIQSCTVWVHFHEIRDRPDGTFEVVPNTDFNVSRTAYKTSQSEYRLNGQKILIKELLKKLRSVGIDLVHNRFLILQGEVEQIAMMKPKAINPNEEGMLEYLEDIIGSSRFKEPIDLLVKKLESLQADKSHQNSRVHSAGKEKDRLEAPFKEMINFMRLENEVTVIKSKQATRKMIKTQAQMEESSPKLVAMENDLKKCMDELETLGIQLKEKKNLIKALQTEQDVVSQDLQKVESELGVLTANETKRANDMKRANNEVKKMTAEINKEKAKLQEAIDAPEHAKQRIQVLKASEDDRADKVRMAQEMHDEALPKYSKKTEAEREKKSKLEEEYGSLVATQTDAEGQLRMAESELNNLMEDENRKKSQLAQCETTIETNKKNSAEKEGKLKELQDKMPGKQKELETTRKNYADWKTRHDAIEHELRQLNSVVESSSQDAMNTQSMSKVLKALLDAKAGGQIKGFYGRLGDLGSIDAKYDIAISTTCTTLDHYVVDTINTADECINILRNGNHGMGTFMALEKVAKNFPQGAMDRKPQNEWNAPRLFDLVQVNEPDARPAFYHALRETLVAKDIDQATKMSKKLRCRVVTLKAEVIETNGAMTGGGRPNEGKIGKRGNKPHRSKADEEADAKKVADAKKKIQELTAEMGDVNHSISNAEKTINDLNASIRDDDRAIKSLKLELKTLVDRLQVQEKQLEDIKKKVGQVAADEKQVKKMKDNIGNLKNDFEQAKTEAAALKKKIAAVDKEIQEISDKMYKPHKERLEHAKSEVAKAEKELNEAEATCNNSERNVAKSKARLAELEKDIDKKRGKTSDLVKLETVYSKADSELKEKKKNGEEKLKEAEAKLKEARALNTELDSTEVELNNKKRKMVEECADAEKEIQHLKHVLAAISKELSDLRLHNIRSLLDTVPVLDPGLVNKESAKNIIFGASDSEDERDGEESDDGEERRKKKAEAEEAAKKNDESIEDGVLPAWTRSHLDSLDWAEVKARLADLERQREAKKNAVDKHVINDYRDKVQRFKDESEQLNSINQNYTKHRDFLEKLKKERLHEFMGGFECISYALRELYQMITIGGDASLELKDLIDPFIEGVQFMVRPPKKSWKQIENLSGGEKTLSSLALVFALHHYRPTPLYVMDEIDAALDFRNVSIIGHYIKDRTKDAQFIIISLRNNMFELADRLIGIYKVHDCTRNVVVDPKGVLESTKHLRSGLNKMKALATANATAFDALMNPAAGSDRTSPRKKRVNNAEEDENLPAE